MIFYRSIELKPKFKNFLRKNGITYNHVGESIWVKSDPFYRLRFEFETGYIIIKNHADYKAKFTYWLRVDYIDELVLKMQNIGLVSKLIPPLRYPEDRIKFKVPPKKAPKIKSSGLFVSNSANG